MSWERALFTASPDRHITPKSLRRKGFGPAQGDAIFLKVLPGGRALRHRQPVGNLSGDNQATLTSSGTTFRFEDDLDDVWGEVSAGVNFFNPSASTAVFAKLDVTFGNDVEGIGGKAGMRVSW